MKNVQYFLDKVKVWSGVFLFFYAATHLLNHAFGMISVDAMEQARLVFVAFWRSPPLNYATVVALLVHGGLAIAKTVRRKSFRGLSRNEWVQLVIGLIGPVGLIGHIMATKVAHEAYGVDDTYSYYLLTGGQAGLIQGIVAVILVWWHGVIGVDGVLSTKRWYPAWRSRLQVAAYSIPLAAIAGAVSASHQVLLRAELDPSFAPRALRDVLANGRSLSEWEAMLSSTSERLALAYLLVITGLLAVRFGLLWNRRRRHQVSVQYPDGSAVNIARGTSVLEASLMGRIPHAHLCGGRGRCSTCRVRIYEGRDALSPPGPLEQRVLRQIGAAENIRLACQTFPQADCRVYPILPSDTNVKNFADRRFLQGSDRKVAILFADLRGFTSFAEHRLPFDVVFVLNQYFQAVGRSIETRGGYLDKFIGDGAMALFGLDVPLKTACRQALEAAWEMGRELEHLNRRLAAELPQPLQIGIGLHCGDAIVAKMGYKHTNHLTAIGDAVNTAARLEALTKDFGAQLVVSAEVAERAGFDLASFASTDVMIRGKTATLRAHVVPLVDQLPVQGLPEKARQPQMASV